VCGRGGGGGSNVCTNVAGGSFVASQVRSYVCQAPVTCEGGIAMA
jgi:hypothetical protein